MAGSHEVRGSIPLCSTINFTRAFTALVSYCPREGPHAPGLAAHGFPSRTLSTLSRPSRQFRAPGNLPATCLARDSWPFFAFEHSGALQFGRFARFSSGVACVFPGGKALVAREKGREVCSIEKIGQNRASCETRKRKVCPIAFFDQGVIAPEPCLTLGRRGLRRMWRRGRGLPFWWGTSRGWRRRG